MISNRKILSALFILSSLSITSNIQPSSRYHYFSNKEVFQIIESRDERGFDLWMRSHKNVNIFNSYNQTPLMIAAQLQLYSFVTRLLDAGAYKHYVDDFGKTARDYALIAEGYYNSPSYSSSSNSGNFWGAVGTGVAAGLCAAALYGICKEVADAPAVTTSVYVGYHNNAYDYCSKCGSVVEYYQNDPQSLYCNGCYYDYCNQKAAYDGYSSSFRVSDRL